MKLRRLILAGSIFALAGCNGGDKPAAPSDPTKPVHVGGTIKNVTKEGTFVVEGNRGTFNIESAKAIITVRQKPAKVEDLKDGAFVIVTGTKTADKISATKVEVQHFAGDLPDKPASQGTSKI